MSDASNRAGAWALAILFACSSLAAEAGETKPESAPGATSVPTGTSRPVFSSERPVQTTIESRPDGVKDVQQRVEDAKQGLEDATPRATKARPGVSPPVQRAPLKQPIRATPKAQGVPGKPPTLAKPPVRQAPAKQRTRATPKLQPRLAKPPLQRVPMKQRTLAKPPVSQAPAKPSTRATPKLQPSLAKPPLQQVPMKQRTLAKPSPLESPSKQLERGPVRRPVSQGASATSPRTVHNKSDAGSDQKVSSAKESSSKKEQKQASPRSSGAPLAGTSMDRPSLDYALGAVCEKNSDCSSGACYDSHGTAGVTCVPRNGTGRLGDYCRLGEQCEGNLYCRRQDGSRTCSKPELLLGERCGGTSRLLGIVYQYAKNGCSSGRCDAGTKVCIPPDFSEAVDGFCTHPNHCASRICVARSCRATETVALGSMCAGSNEVCQSGVCDQTPGKPAFCVPDLGRGQIGDYCSDFSQCATQNCADRMCARVGSAKLGHDCSVDRDCENSRCDPHQPHRCIPHDGMGITGDYCSHPNHCIDGMCGGSRCQEAVTADVGELCFGYQAVCKSGICDGSRRPDRCVPEPVLGELGSYCTQDGQCSTLRCDRTYGCVAAGKGVDGQDGEIGSSCTQNGDCIHGRCDVSGWCIPNDGAGDVNDKCSANKQCRPGQYCDLQGVTAIGNCQVASR